MNDFLLTKIVLSVFGKHCFCRKTNIEALYDVLINFEVINAMLLYYYNHLASIKVVEEKTEIEIIDRNSIFYQCYCGYYYFLLLLIL